MKRVLVVAPHPDDEVLGAGGALLRHRDAGDEVHWLVVTAMRPEDGYSPERIFTRADELEKVKSLFGFKHRHELGFPAAKLDGVPRGELVQAMAGVIRSARPDVVYLPNPGDAHSDHAAVFAAANAALKWFRAPFAERILIYETPSETGFNLDPQIPAFNPNWYVDIERYLQEKLAILSIYESEVGTFPFPRSLEAVTALAHTRGSLCGVKAAEAFMLIRGLER